MELLSYCSMVVAQHGRQCREEPVDSKMAGMFGGGETDSQLLRALNCETQFNFFNNTHNIDFCFPIQKRNFPV